MASKIGEIKAELSQLNSVPEYEAFCDKYLEDDRQGVVNLVTQAKKKRRTLFGNNG